jgi:hypothetical protein
MAALDSLRLVLNGVFESQFLIFIKVVTPFFLDSDYSFTEERLASQSSFEIYISYMT